MPENPQENQRSACNSWPCEHRAVTGTLPSPRLQSAHRHHPIIESRIVNRTAYRARRPFFGLLALALVVLPTWTAWSADPPAIAPEPRRLDGPSTVPDSYVK